MVHPTRTIHCLAADDEGNLAGATVVDTPLGARATLTQPIAGALERPADRLAPGLPKIKRGDALLFICPSSLASLRPFALTARHWAGAKEDVLASVGTLFPLTPDDARVGVMDLAGDDTDDAPSRGVLVAASAAALRPWLEHLHAATGRTPDAVLAPAQCLPALGLARDEHARVLEPAGPDETVEHTLRYAEPLDVARPPSPDADAPTLRLPGVPASAAPGAPSVTLPELALAGALMPTLARSRTAPLDGAMPARRSRWLLPAASLLLAGVLVWLALAAPAQRTGARLQEINEEQAAIEDDVRRVAATRREALTLHTLLGEAIAPTLDRWSPTLPELEAARAALPEGVWLYSIGLDETTLKITGVANDPTRVLRAIESSDAFTGARFEMPPGPVPNYEGERFQLVARRVSATAQPTEATR